MTIKTRVTTALENTGIPVFFGAWKPTTEAEEPPDIYLVFTTVTRPNRYADNVRKGWRHYIYLNLWAKVPYSSQKDSVISAMEIAGFSIIDIEDRLEEETGMNLCALSCFFLEAV